MFVSGSVLTVKYYCLWVWGSKNNETIHIEGKGSMKLPNYIDDLDVCNTSVK